MKIQNFICKRYESLLALTDYKEQTFFFFLLRITRMRAGYGRKKLSACFVQYMNANQLVCKKQDRKVREN